MHGRIFCGIGEIVHGLSGVDLSLFPHIIVDHLNPDGANIRDLKDWFVALFQMNENLYSVMVQCLYLRGINPAISELRIPDRTYKWRKWVERCRWCNVPLTILVQPCTKEVAGESSSSQSADNKSGCCGDVPFDQLEIREEGGTQWEEIDVDGVADGGGVQGIVEDLEAVDRNAIEEEKNLNMDNDMDDEDEKEDDIMATQTPVPDEWNRPDVSSMEAMDMHESRYQYGCCMIEQDQLFSNKQELKNTMSCGRWGIMTSNLVEVYNWVISGLRGLPLIAIIEEKSVSKASQHIVPAMGTHDNRFQIIVRAKGGVGRETTLVTHEADLGMEIQHDASEAVALLCGRDLSSRYHDVIEMFARLGQKAKHLMEVVTCRQADDIVRDWSSAGQHVYPVGAFVVQGPAPVFQPMGYAGFNPVPAPASEGFGFGGTPQEMDLPQFFTYPQLTPATQEIVEEEVVPVAVPQRREIRPAARFSPADCEKPRAPVSAWKPKRARGEQQGRGRGQG
ncbi:hypothetical protein C2845_PM14G08190 [Panicum miliaceum]|uniref:Uncharacterized protein n=1 Tax=Panicum miliaceum TaxID=4540 RepID=A0A3L6PP02_PANMI|nr:hypothetical protein C2845_PM14G08190 [Panicum miliaceum]